MTANISEIRASALQAAGISLTALRMAGGVLMLLGVAAIAAPLLAAVAVESMMAFVMLFAGVGEAYAAWSLGRRGGAVGHGLCAAAYLACGAALMAFPLGGIMSLTFVIGAGLLLGGVAKIFLRPAVASPRGLRLFDGVLGIALGLLILLDWPDDSAWVLGLLVGVRLVASGVVLLLLRFEAQEPAEPKG